MEEFIARNKSRLIKESKVVFTSLAFMAGLVVVIYISNASQRCQPLGALSIHSLPVSQKAHTVGMSPSHHHVVCAGVLV